MAKQQEEAKKPTHVVIKEFHDIDNFDKVHEVGDDVSHFDKERLDKLVENGHVEVVKAETEPPK
ncbi:hypothetical protein GO755_34920 [Spirosoma sp. HMF4905]|uniref:Uncharacterized protein n=1 Tax=Spirosoma arboris TaxID=2682092 RepID=A0A7K1SNC2_9BACT|nr:hypothetical protein [Spirosoma arboris]MVM35267.1 hypothetical protein [Spirosoma arboris]